MSKMSKMSKAKMARAALHLEQVFPGWVWDVTPASEAELGEPFDPPCGFMEGKLGNFRLLISDDGEVYDDLSCSSNYQMKPIPSVDISLRPENVALAVRLALQSHFS